MRSEIQRVTGLPPALGMRTRAVCPTRHEDLAVEASGAGSTLMRTVASSWAGSPTGTAANL